MTGVGVVTGGGVEEEEDGAFDRKENIPAPLPLLAATGASLLVEGGEGGGDTEVGFFTVTGDLMVTFAGVLTGVMGLGLGVDAAGRGLGAGAGVELALF